jgi:hypothetical protein
MVLKEGVEEIYTGDGNPLEDFEQDTDEHGRMLPCCEWWYNEDGYDEMD